MEDLSVVILPGKFVPWTYFGGRLDCRNMSMATFSKLDDVVFIPMDIFLSEVS